MTYTVIYDGNCNLCSTLVQGLEALDQGQRFQYVPMQDEQTLAQWQITAQDCELGMILIKHDNPAHRWQGSEAAEMIAQLLPGGDLLIGAYRGIPGLKRWGDRSYEYIRDHRYTLFGRRAKTYQTTYPTCSNCS